ncbi:MAG TPA: serine/threonine-protein phosphatase [Gammaproteobacteria bacterium]|nr:serine/threonine-protein phosphatase [Gammaproteobacteria bacterium]
MAFSTCGHVTHVGNVRAHNEDCYIVDAEANFCVLADGMGGHEGGEIASRIVVDCVSHEIRNGTPMPEALVQAHYAVRKAIDNGDGKPGMGSTAVALKLDNGHFDVVWVGDSRAYVWDGKQLTQITKDHSLVQHMVDEGRITPAEALVHPQRNYITQAIGMSDLYKMEVGRVQGRLQHGQQLLLCSDGLSGEVSAAEMTDILELDLNESQKVDLMIQKSLDNGGADNVTALLVTAVVTDD